ncbi:hypothetical protein EON64_03065 [archaeon]|nr:MAG: hypothetical protein EON64_03065 [archaeon]
MRAADSHHRDDEEEEGDEGGLALASQGSADSTLVCGRLRCKLLVEEDRRLYAQEQGYEHTLLVRMKETASPKRDIVLGWVDGAL